MSSNSEIERLIRRLKPQKQIKRLHPRSPAELPFFRTPGDLATPLLLDSTVYVDALRGTLPHLLGDSLGAAPLWHSSVTEAELTALIGLLNPAHPDTAEAIRQVIDSLERRPKHKILTPDGGIWREAGVLTGILARLQQYGKADQRRTFNDTLIFLTAVKNGCTVLTRNVADFDLLQQLAPHGRVLFYELRER